MANKFLIVVLSVAFGLAATAQAGELYKWTDDKGVLHYSDTPPPGHPDATRVRVQSGVSDEAAPPQTAVAEKPKEAPKTNNQAAAAPAAPLDRNAACDQARSNLGLLQSKYAVADASGKQLDDKTRQALTEQAKQAVADCSKS
jgi:hypothetical protein